MRLWNAWSSLLSLSLLFMLGELDEMTTLRIACMKNELIIWFNGSVRRLNDDAIWWQTICQFLRFIIIVYVVRLFSGRRRQTVSNASEDKSIKIWCWTIWYNFWWLTGGVWIIWIVIGTTCFGKNECRWQRQRWAEQKYLTNYWLEIEFCSALGFYTTLCWNI